MCASPRNVTRRYAGHVSGPNVSSRRPRGATRMNQIRTLLPAPGCRAPFFDARMFQHGVIFRTPARSTNTPINSMIYVDIKCADRAKRRRSRRTELKQKSRFMPPFLHCIARKAKRLNDSRSSGTHPALRGTPHRRIADNDLANDSGLWGRQAERRAATGSGKHNMLDSRNEKTWGDESRFARGPNHVDPSIRPARQSPARRPAVARMASSRTASRTRSSAHRTIAL